MALPYPRHQKISLLTKQSQV